MLNLNKRSKQKWDVIINNHTKIITKQYKQNKTQPDPIIFFEKKMQHPFWLEQFNFDIDTAQDFIKYARFAKQIERYVIQFAKEEAMDRVRERFIEKLQS